MCGTTQKDGRADGVLESAVDMFGNAKHLTTLIFLSSDRIKKQKTNKVAQRNHSGFDCAKSQRNFGNLFPDGPPLLVQLIASVMLLDYVNWYVVAMGSF